MEKYITIKSQDYGNLLMSNRKLSCEIRRLQSIIDQNYKVLYINEKNIFQVKTGDYDTIKMAEAFKGEIEELKSCLDDFVKFKRNVESKWWYQLFNY